MFQPNKELRAILVAAVKPESLQVVTEHLISSIMEHNLDYFTISDEFSVTGKYIHLTLSPENFDEVLEFGKWYPREKFDGNPCDQMLLEFDSKGDVISSDRAPWNKGLYSDTVKFMYIKKP